MKPLFVSVCPKYLSRSPDIAVRSDEDVLRPVCIIAIFVDELPPRTLSLNSCLSCSLLSSFIQQYSCQILQLISISGF